ncbi:MAG: hypothetical protein RLZZ494_1893 [Pseudomonadota bacterium]|jgi:ketosteroid isomerase-like protein
MDTAEEDPTLARLAHFFEHLRPDTLVQLGAHYHPTVVFKDPFQEVQGLAALQRIFRHMFDVLEAPRFVVHTRVRQGQEAFLTWDFHGRARGWAFTLHGASHLRFGDDGRIVLHRDYWDTAEELYAKLPGLGGVVRWLRRRLAAPQ